MPWKYSDLAASGWRRFLIALVAVLAMAASLSALYSCARKPTASQQKSVVQSTAVSPTPSANPAPTAPLPATVPHPVAPPVPLAASIRGFGLGAPSTPHLPWDYSLGPLQSSRPAEGDEAAAYAVATSFLKGISEGKLDKGLLLPQSRDALSAILAPTARGSTSGSAAATEIPYRLGAIVISGLDASMRLRLPAAAGEPRAEGLLSLRKSGDAWYVEALALDPPEEGPLVFNPDAGADAGAQRR